MLMTDADAVVVGAGVVGLTTAISLAEAGLATRVVTAAPPSATTSVAAGAIWGPVRCGPPELCHAWARFMRAGLLESSFSMIGKCRLSLLKIPFESEFKQGREIDFEFARTSESGRALEYKSSTHY